MQIYWEKQEGFTQYKNTQMKTATTTTTTTTTTTSIIVQRREEDQDCDAKEKKN